MKGRGSAGGGSNDGRASIIDGRGETVVYGGEMGGTTLRHARAIFSRGGAPWTPSLVNALVARVGYSSDISPIPCWDALLLEYDVPIDW